MAGSESNKIPPRTGLGFGKALDTFRSMQAHAELRQIGYPARLAYLGSSAVLHGRALGRLGGRGARPRLRRFASGC